MFLLYLCTIAGLSFFEFFDRRAVRAEHVRWPDRAWIYGEHIFCDVVAVTASLRKDFRSFEFAINAVVASFESLTFVKI